MTVEVILLALAASGFTALASVAQRHAAAPAPEHLSFSLKLVGYLLRRPVWFMGIACMILGFVFQIDALRVGSLTVVQPVIATELVIVFAFVALTEHRRVQGRDWFAAAGMVVGLGAFLALAHPIGGRLHSNAWHWFVAGLSTLVGAALIAVLAYWPRFKGQVPSASRKAAFLGISAAAGFGFVAAVVKELSTHLHDGWGLFLTWSPYVLLISGALSMFLASNAFQAGSLAASQPGLTIVDPLVASTFGVVLFGERLDLQPAAFFGEVGALTLLIACVVLLSRSPLIQAAPPKIDSGPPGEVGPPPSPKKDRERQPLRVRARMPSTRMLQWTVRD